MPAAGTRQLSDTNWIARHIDPSSNICSGSSPAAGTVNCGSTVPNNTSV